MAISSFLDFSRTLWQKLDLSESQAETMAARTQDVWQNLSADARNLLNSLVADYFAINKDSALIGKTDDADLAADAASEETAEGKAVAGDNQEAAALPVRTLDAETLSDGIDTAGKKAEQTASLQAPASVDAALPTKPQAQAAAAADNAHPAGENGNLEAAAPQASSGPAAAVGAVEGQNAGTTAYAVESAPADTQSGTLPDDAQDISEDITQYEGWTYFGGDEFNGSELDTGKWFAYGDRFGTSNKGYNQSYGSNMKMLQKYTPEMVQVEGGNLVITSKRDEANQKFGHDAWVSGAISSRETEYLFPLYSRVDVSAKIANDIGIWHAPWLRHYNGASTAEIDIGEYFANYKNPKTGLHEYNTVTQSLHLHDEKSKKLSISVGRKGMRTTLDDEIDENFHLYSVIVERGEAENQAKISYLVDNEVQYSVLTDQDSARDYNKFITDAVEDGRTENTWDFIFQGGIGGDNPNMGNPKDGLNEVKSEIDYVRVYVKDEDYADLAAARAAADGQVISEADTSKILQQKTQTTTGADGKQITTTIYEKAAHNLEYITGNGGNNILQGNDKANHLSGYEGDDRLIGGKGADELVGALGADVFVLDNSDGVDQILDFLSGTDKIEISSEFFNGFSGKGAMSEQDFSDRIGIWKAQSQNFQMVSYKPLEGGKWVDLAKVGPDFNLTHNDFIIG